MWLQAEKKYFALPKNSKKGLELPVLSRDKKSWREELERGKERSSQDGVWPESMSGDTTDEKPSGYRGWKKTS